LNQAENKSYYIFTTVGAWLKWLLDNLTADARGASSAGFRAQFPQLWALPRTEEQYCERHERARQLMMIGAEHLLNNSLSPVQAADQFSRRHQVSHPCHLPIRRPAAMSGSVLASPSLPSPGNVELSGVRDGISRSASKKQIRTAGSIDPTPTSISSVTARHLSSSDHHSDDEHHGTPLVAGRRGSDALPLGSGSALSGRAGYDSAHGAVINVRLEDIVTLVRAQEVADPGK
jgi:hypothetical protein